MTALRTAKGLFLLTMLIGSALYTAVAFDLPWTTTAGRIGAGFFPRIIGLLLAVSSGWALFDELAGRSPDVQQAQEQASADEPTQVRDTLVVVALIVAFVPALYYLGALIGMVLFTLVTLFTFNRGRVLTNVAVGVGFPVVLFLLFDRGLNATLPPGVFDLVPF
ncbi:MAG: tripartite tricarboxylate transporter TctB family protein [Euzebyales bacterium]|nr:tripartite tricarboxylate transporter TctB family protein [Euzebyales bacterium]